MERHPEAYPGATLRGAVYGDLIGSPYRVENTYNRYFELGSSRRAYSQGKVRSFFPEATEVSHGAAATVSWLTTYRDSPTTENLQRCLRRQFEAHPKGGWTEPTRLFLSSGMERPSLSPDWSAVTRAVPIASFVRDDLPRALGLTEACVKATCLDGDTVLAAQALTHGIWMALHGSISAEIFSRLTFQYGLQLVRSDEEIRSELRGEVREPLVMLGRPVERAFRYVLPDYPAPPPGRLIVEAAVRAVSQSDSWEDAVRRAVAFGGPSNAVAGIAGALAEALYGEVTPTIVGKLFTYVPMDITRQLEALERRPAPRVERKGPTYERIGKNAITAVTAGDETLFVVPEERDDVRRLLERSFPGVRIIPPSERASFEEGFRERRQGTYAYGPRPEERTFYVQDGERIVSPTQYVAPGMPSLQERRRHLTEFLSLRDWCIDRQTQMNALAGNSGAGQVHYGSAYHLWIGRERIDFLMGDRLAGRIRLDGRGLMKVELGEYRDVSADARFENYREQAWESRSLFTIPQSVSPMEHLGDIRETILSRLLDEGLGLTGKDESRDLSEEERLDRSPVSNIERLEPLEGDEDRGIPAREGTGGDLFPVSGSPSKGKVQPVQTVYSIGYGIRSREGFINALKMLGVDTVVDVRAIPKSRYAPQFDADDLYATLQEAGIGYFLAGDKLGVRPKEISLYGDDGRVDWEKVRREEGYQSGIEAIRAMAAEGRSVAIAGSEGDPLSSHRFGTVSRDLAEAGLEVRHLLPGGELVPQAILEERLLRRYTDRGLVVSTLTGTYREQVNEAFRLLNTERGYKPSRGKGVGTHWH